MIGLWATYSSAVLPRTGPDPALTADLEKAARAQGPTGELARRLLEALRATGEEREHRLDEATEWLRRHHPRRPRSGGDGRSAIRMWCGWAYDIGLSSGHSRADPIPVQRARERVRRGPSLAQSLKLRSSSTPKGQPQISPGRCPRRSPQLCSNIGSMGIIDKKIVVEKDTNLCLLWAHLARCTGRRGRSSGPPCEQHHARLDREGTGDRPVWHGPYPDPKPASPEPESPGLASPRAMSSSGSGSRRS